MNKRHYTGDLVLLLQNTYKLIQTESTSFDVRPKDISYKDEYWTDKGIEPVLQLILEQFVYNLYCLVREKEDIHLDKNT